MAVNTLTRSPGKILNDYLSLAKMRTILPHLITAAAAMFMAARGLPSATTLAFTLLGGGIIAASANIFNSYLDRDIDRFMARTRNRPLPSGRLHSFQALIFGIIIGLLGVFVLSELVSWIAALLASVALLYYVLFYTLWLKRRTYWSTIACSGIGAIPPIIGWIAVTGRIGVAPLLLSGIIILWTVPHFWSLAIFRREDYQRAGLIVIPGKHAAAWIALCSVLLSIATFLLVPFGGLGHIYLPIAVILAIILLVMSGRLLWRADNLLAARYFYIFSIIYIMLLFMTIVIDRLVF